MKKWLLILAGFLLFSTSVLAKIETVEAQGYGETYEKAVDAALADAVRQINGIAVSTQSERAGDFIRAQDKKETHIEGKRTYTEHNKVDDDAFLGNKSVNSTYTEKSDVNASGETRRDVSITTGQSAQINTSSAGTVKHYRVKTRDCDAKGCTVVLSVDIEKVERKTSAASLKRDRLAVITTGNRSRSVFADTLRQEITDRIVKSQRYTVLDRSATNEKAFEQEEKFLEKRLHNATDIKQSALPADFLLVINVTEAGIKTTTTVNHVDLTGEFDVTRSHKTNVTVRYSLLEAATHSILWSDVTVFEQSGKYIETARQQISDIIADKIVNKLTPAKVVAVNNGKVIINRGEAMVYEGDRFDIFSQGETLIDPDTGENLGSAEEKVATIAITSIQNKISYGIVESGNINAIEKGAIARLAPPLPGEKKAQSTQSKTKAKSKPNPNEQKLGETGGIFLK